jgi:hypothetical protein
MDLTGALRTLAVRRVGVLLVEVPGWARTRWAAERELRRRGWRMATSSADADVLLVCGEPGDRLRAVCDTVHARMPGPRGWAGARSPDLVPSALDAAAGALFDRRRVQQDLHGRPAHPVMGPPVPAEGQDGHHDGVDAEPADDGSADHNQEDHDQEDHDQENHDQEDHDHGDMEMAPGGVPLAGSGGDDRDGLEMDVLHVPLGPVLPCWPAGLLLRCTLAGDVVVEVGAEVLGADPATPRPTGHEPAAPVLLDRAAQVLSLAGRSDLAVRCERARDALLHGADRSAVPDLESLARRVARGRSLRWALGGTGTVDAEAHGLDPRLSGTVHDRLVRLLDDACTAAAEPGSADRRHAPGTPVDVVPDLVRGLEIGAVRLLVASLDVDTLSRPAAVGAA